MDVLVPASPVLPGRSPIRLHVRDAGTGPAVVLLHGGWGHEAYPFDDAARALTRRHRVLVPDRAGYGQSDPVSHLPRGFHKAMAEETLALLDALDIPGASFWGHSDGAVVAAWIALVAPERVSAVVLESLHLFKAKRSSTAFFEEGVRSPERFGSEVTLALERDHGPGWRAVLARGGKAWLDLIEEGMRDGGDLFDGRLSEVTAPALILHGRRDPRTEPGELDAIRAALPKARLELLDAGHSPHSSSTSGQRAITLAVKFLEANLTRIGLPRRE